MYVLGRQSNDRVGTPLGSIANSSAAPSLISNVRRGSQCSGNAGIQRENYSTYKLDENCSVVDSSMKWEGFSGFYKPRAPFVADRTLSRDPTSPRVQNRSPRRFQSNNIPLTSPARTPTTPSEPPSSNNQR